MNRRKPSWRMIDEEFQELDIWQKLSRAVLALLFVALLGVIWTFLTPDLERERELEAEIARLQKIEQERQDKRDELKEEVRLVQEDPGYLEVIARDRLDLQKPGETVIRIER